MTRIQIDAEAEVYDGAGAERRRHLWIGTEEAGGGVEWEAVLSGDSRPYVTRGRLPSGGVCPVALLRTVRRGFLSNGVRVVVDLDTRCVRSRR